MNNKKYILITGISLLVILIFISIISYISISTDRISETDRIRELDRKYNLSFQDTDIKSIRGKNAQDVNEIIIFEVSDYNGFMQSFSGEICNFNESADQSSATFKCKPYPKSSDNLEKRLTFQIKFEIDGSRYNAILTSYYE